MERIDPETTWSVWSVGASGPWGWSCGLAAHNGCSTQWMDKAGGLRKILNHDGPSWVMGKIPGQATLGKNQTKKPARTEQNDKCVLVMSESECEYAQMESQSHRGGWCHRAMREEARCRAGRRVRT